MRSVSTNGPDPTGLIAPDGSLVKVDTALAETFDQMCSGRIGTERCSICGVGTLVVSTSVLASGAVALTMLATYEP